MYTVTFYSFKGGVGRTMAMVNVAFELARCGSRVLMVDFDLEAPGLDTFAQIRSQPDTRGIVDYVWQYLETDVAPDVRQFVFAVQHPQIAAGRLWVMPTGKQDGQYGDRLNSIDWRRLYEEHDGYMMFDDLKAQWNEFLKPDYVLIDSRTGHTDVGGICTRQLPDAVVILFFPNEQNLRGLTSVVSNIRREAENPREKIITMHFVSSNVPNLDDEDSILAGRINQFRSVLKYEETSAVIHHYDSLALLNQAVFTLDRPRTQLAKEYCQLKQAIVAHNLEDRVGALGFLSNISDSSDRAMRNDIENLEKGLSKVRALHPHDGEILYRLGKVHKSLGRIEEAIALYGIASDNGYLSAELLLDRAQLSMGRGEKESAVSDIRRALDSPHATYVNVNLAFRLLMEMSPGELWRTPDSPALNSLTPMERRFVATELFYARESLPVAEVILRRLYEDTKAGSRELAECDLVLCFIGQGKFTEAMEVLSEKRPDPASARIDTLFNYAMAEWGEKGVPSLDLFAGVVERDREKPLDQKPNWLQCSAIAYWAVGELSEARARVAKAREQVKNFGPDFSAWRYLKVTPRQFIVDLNTFEAMMERGKVTPEFLSSSHSLLPLIENETSGSPYEIT